MLRKLLTKGILLGALSSSLPLALALVVAAVAPATAQTAPTSQSVSSITSLMDDQDGDGISDADEGLECEEIIIQPEVSVRRQGGPCRSAEDTFVLFWDGTPFFIEFGGTCDGAWNDAIDIQLSGLIPGAPVSFDMRIRNDATGNEKPMTATIKGFDDLDHYIESGGNTSIGAGDIPHSFIPTGTTASGRMEISIPDVERFGGDIRVRFHNFRQILTPDPDNPIEHGSEIISCEDVDTDGDGVPDYLDLDSDNDGILDADELDDDTDGDDIGDWRDLDSDNDGISDLVEGGTDPNEFDPDRDGYFDPDDFPDLDDDGIIDALEELHGEDTGVDVALLDPDNDDVYNFRDLDSDGDGIPDTIEAVPTTDYKGNDGNVSDDDADRDGIIAKYDLNDASPEGFGGHFDDPVNTDAGLSNGDDLPDYLDTNSDGDAFTDSEERGDGITDPSYTDPDGNVDVPEEVLRDSRDATDEVDYRESCGVTLDPIDDKTICEGESYALPPLDLGNYFSGPGETGAPLAVGDIISEGTTIYVFARSEDEPDCTTEVSFEVIVHSFVPGVIAQDQSVCTGGTIETLLPATDPVSNGTMTYQWQSGTDGSNFEDIPGATAASFAPSPVTVDTYFRRRDISTLNEAVCEDFTNTVKITVNRISALGTLTGDQAICYGSAPDTLITERPTEATGELVYQWQSSTDGISFSDITGADDENFTPGELIEDTWFRRVDAVAPFGGECASPTPPVKITVLDPIALPDPSQRELTCADGDGSSGVEITLDIDSITGGTGTIATIAFVDDNGTPGDPQDDTLLQSGPSNVYLEQGYEARNIVITVTDSGGCAGATTTFVEARDPLRATLEVEHELCLGQANGRILVDVQGGTPPYATSLDSQATEDFVQDRLVFDGLSGGRDHIVYLRDANNCQLALHAILDAPVDLSADIDVQYFCADGTNQQHNSVSVNIDPELLPGSIFTVSGPEVRSGLEPLFNDLAAGDYDLIIAYENGCEVQNQAFTVQEPFEPLALALSNETINTITATATGGDGDYFFTFQGQANGRDNEFRFRSSGTYTVQVADGLGCIVEQQIDVTFLPITVPNYFTPDENNFNDGWKPRNIESYPAAVTLIYDRYGRHLGTIKSLETWDGNYEGMPMPSGDYWYVIQLNDDTAVSLDPIVGHFTLYR